MAQKLQSTMAAKEIKIAFFGKLSQRFIRKDPERGRKHFKVRVSEPPKSKREWLSSPKKVKKLVKESNIVFGWFAGWHTAPAVHRGTAIGDTGFYVPYGDEKAAAEAIKKALEASNESERKARERIIKLFPLGKREKKLKEIIIKISKEDLE